ncbi:sensor histidine kinase, partial [Ruminococcaceae bacterium OttesenSCG-928-D13]|nr:sensor histidine kinase [Ruminococcaceae bacterium OttesenSCG-928-D13]
MNSSITKRWVRGSLFFTLAVVLVAEGLFLYFTISTYYKDARQAISNQFTSLRDQMTPASSSAEERRQKLLQTVE